MPRETGKKIFSTHPSKLTHWQPAKIFGDQGITRLGFIIISSWLLFSAPLLASDADQTGVTAFRAATTNLFGQGVRVCQAEAVDTGTEDFEVNPANVGAPTNIFTYYSSLGSSSNYPNSFGTNATHPESVAKFFYGTVSPGYTPCGIATNLAHVDLIDADYFYNSRVGYALGPISMGDPIINESYTYGVQTVTAQQSLDSEFDNYSVRFNTLQVASVGFPGAPAPPGSGYNCVSVGCYNPGGANTATGPTLDNGRCKPDLIAPDPNTSFACPQISGSLAVLLQAAARGDGGSPNVATNMMTLKALLLNGTVKPTGWTNGPTAPLDARYGAGMLNLYNSYVNLIGGRQTNLVSVSTNLGSVFQPNATLTNNLAQLVGWDFNTNTSTSTKDNVYNYYLTVTNAAKTPSFTATATLVWNRHASTANINYLRLYLYNVTNKTLVNCSTSVVDNVQHLYLPQLAAGRYDLQVIKSGGSYVSASEPYALAYSFTPSPQLKVSLQGTNAVLSWPLYPDGFSLQATNRLAPVMAWSSANLPSPIITNGSYQVNLPATNTTEFFRLATPYF